MLYHLPPHVSFGFLGEQAVALDLRTDRYYLLKSAEAAALRCGDSGTGADPDPVLDALVRRQLLGRGAGAPITPVATLPPRSSALETEGAGSRVPLLEVAGFRASASLHLRVRSLNAALLQWRRLRRRYARRLASIGADRNPARIARGFANARVLLPARQLCVPDSLALARTLWRRGIAADLIFGVRLAPFMAHAWVQHGDILLSDTLNTVGEYTPVFRL